MHVSRYICPSRKQRFAVAVALFSILAAQPLQAQTASPANRDLKTFFAHPPKGYGEVPFYWWNGDTLLHERLAEQLDMLAEAPVEGFSVSYIHTNPQVDTLLNRGGYGGFGRADGGKPEVFSPEWWDVWRWFSEQCAERGMAAGLDDYVVARPGNGYFIDRILEQPKYRNFGGRLTKNADSIEIIPSPELHPDYGRDVVQHYFQAFEDSLSPEGRRGMNYFFQDELVYDLNLHSWCEDMPKQFQRRKGYDIRPYLRALFDDIGPITPKIRMDYAEVVTELAEERYFRPIYEWHASRGLIYGCDNTGRGTNPTEYLDYYRALSWFTAPGNDAPSRGSSFRQTKVSSSIAHLYNRPRTWLEAFHSMGWDSRADWLTAQLDHHVIAGGNLLCLHGLYYSTHGGWWEWAPPCFHYRMPYWNHTRNWLRYAERLCFLMSQGRHRCDIAVVYPTETRQVDRWADISSMWKMVDSLSQHGLDYDFIDYASLRRSTVEDGRLCVSGEEYTTVILADIRALQQSSLEALKRFAEGGGTVLTVSTMPSATTLRGRDDAETLGIIKEVLGKNFLSDYRDVVPWLSNSANHHVPDFATTSGRGRVMHRQADGRDIYMVMDVAPADSMFFRQTGKAELWSAKDGTTEPIPVLEQSAAGTWIKNTNRTSGSQIIVFSSGQPLFECVEESLAAADTIPVGSEWKIRYVPTMNNRWGDYRHPARDEMIGVEAREVYSAFDAKNRQRANELWKLTATTSHYGFAPYILMAVVDNDTPIPNPQSPLPTSPRGGGKKLQKSELSILNQRSSTGAVPSGAAWGTNAKGDNSHSSLLTFSPYLFSWQYGVQDSPGSQGYHGLKERVDDRFLILDKGGTQIFYTQVYAPRRDVYTIFKEGVVPDSLLIDGREVSASEVSLKKGWHTLLLVYRNTQKADYQLERMKVDFNDKRNRSAVVLAPRGEQPVEADLSMKWAKMNHLAYSPVGGEKGTWRYIFDTAPGTEKLVFDTAESISGVFADKTPATLRGDTLDIVSRRPVSVSFSSEIPAGSNAIGAALLREPVKMVCGEGDISLGDWTLVPGLKYYSGEADYSTVIPLSGRLREAKALGRHIVLSLGEVDATCDLFVNGKKVAELTGHPFEADVTQYLVEGDNEIEVKVFSTLANHYQSIPTPYRGQPHAGLIGPVSFILH